MKFFSIIMLASSLMVVNYVYASENGKVVPKYISISADGDTNSVEEIKGKALKKRVNFKNFNGNKEVKKRLEQEPTGPYNDVFVPDTCCDMESCCCVTMAGILGVLFICTKETGNVLLDKKIN